jgi:hypothetical protein
MRAPDDKKRLIRLPGAPPIEWACRLAGGSPRGTVLRRTQHKRLVQLIQKSAGNFSQREVLALADYLRGKFDRKPEQGRPFDPWRHVASTTPIEIVQRIQREEKCTLRRAIDLAIPLLELDAAAAQRLWKRMTR